HRLRGIEKQVVEPLEDGFKRLWLLADVELHRVAGHQPRILELFEHAKLMTRFHAAEEHDPRFALVGGEHRGEPTIGALVGALVAGGSRLVVRSEEHTSELQSPMY